MGGREEGYYGLFSNRARADGWSLIWVVYRQEGDGGGDKADGPHLLLNYFCAQSPRPVTR